MEKLVSPPIAHPRPILPPDERAMILHDVLGALSGVTGGIATIDRSKLDPDLALQVERIAAAAESAARIARSTLGPAVTDREAVDLGWLRREILRRWAGEAAARGASLQVEVEGDMPDRLAVDPVDLMRVLANLLGNAVKFSETGPIVFALRRRCEGGLLLSVRDYGPGLGGCDAARIFDYGYSGAGEGGGIGLHIARSLAERMGGTLTVADAPGGGVWARLDLPARLCLGTPVIGRVRSASPADRAGDALPAPLLADAAGEGAMPDLSGYRLLLVEDNATNRLVASEMLAGLGAKMHCAADGVEALDVFERERFDLVLVDIEMPRLSGLDVIRTIRSRRDARARTPLVALTAYAMREHRLRIAEVGANGLISKPIFDARIFGAAVAEYLRDRPRNAEEAKDRTEEPLVDEAVFSSLAETIGPELMAELLDRIVIDLESVRDGLVGALGSGDAAGIRTQSHILISVAGAFGAARLRMRATDLNAAAHDASDAGALPNGAAHPGAAAQGASGGLAREVMTCVDEIGPALAYVKEQRAKC